MNSEISGGRAGVNYTIGWGVRKWESNIHNIQEPNVFTSEPDQSAVLICSGDRIIEVTWQCA